MNKVVLMGRLTKNPEIKYAGKDNDMAVARYTPVSYTHLTFRLVQSCTKIKY